jgi:hypothetical protein
VNCPYVSNRSTYAPPPVYIENNLSDLAQAIQRMQVDTSYNNDSLKEREERLQQRERELHYQKQVDKLTDERISKEHDIKVHFFQAEKFTFKAQRT